VSREEGKNKKSRVNCSRLRTWSWGRESKDTSDTNGKEKVASLETERRASYGGIKEPLQVIDKKMGVGSRRRVDGELELENYKTGR